MAYESGDFEANFAAAAGDDPALKAELRRGFVESLLHHVDLLHRARCDGNWYVAAQRLKGLGASFHAQELAKLGAEAVESAPGDPVILRKLTKLAANYSGQD